MCSVNVSDEVSDQVEVELLEEVTKVKVLVVETENPNFISQEVKLPSLGLSLNEDSRTR